MLSAFKNLLVGVVVFAAVNYLLGTSLFTGTDAGTTILTALLSLIVAMGVLFASFKMFGAKG